MAVALAALQQTHKLLHDQKRNESSENPQTHRHDVIVLGS